MDMCDIPVKLLEKNPVKSLRDTILVLNKALRFLFTKENKTKYILLETYDHIIKYHMKQTG